MTTINEYAKQITAWGQRKGWDMSKARADGDVRRDFVLGKLMLVVTEIAEAAECVRDDQFEQTGGVPASETPGGFGVIGGKDVTKPEGMVTELADAVIRILHLCDAMGLDLDAAIEAKMAYNEGRPYQHGRKA